MNRYHSGHRVSAVKCWKRISKGGGLKIEERGTRFSVTKVDLRMCRRFSVAGVDPSLSVFSPSISPAHSFIPCKALPSRSEVFECGFLVCGMLIARLGGCCGDTIRCTDGIC